MATADLFTVSRDFLDYLVGKATPEEIANFKISDTMQARANELTEKNKAGTLTPEEKHELDVLLDFHLFMTELKARAAKSIQQG